MRKRHEDEHENLERWLLTYCDLITLLLAFFVVMYSMSEVDAKKFGSMSIHLRSILNGQIGILKGAPVISGNAEMGNLLRVQPIDLKLVREDIMAAAEEGGFKESISPTMDERGVVVHITDTALFEEGKADLTPAARAMLDRIAPEISGMPNLIRVEGHTDDTPIQTLLFPSNWELSVARSTTVVRYLIDSHRISPYRISAMGYGEFRPIAPNNSVENKARNRRIDIVVLSTEGAESEPPVLEEIGAILDGGAPEGAAGGGGEWSGGPGEEIEGRPAVQSTRRPWAPADSGGEWSYPTA